MPADEQIGELAPLQKEGKIRHIGLSEVSMPELKRAQSILEIVSVQNLYNLTNRQSEHVLDYATANDIGFIPWFPLATGELATPGSVLDEAAKRHDATPAQLALAWLLHRSPVMLPIPGTSKVAHLDDNLAAADITLTDKDVATLASFA